MRTPSRRSSRPASALAESDWTRNDAGASPLPHRAERKHHAGVVHQEPPHPSGPLRRVQQSHGPTPTKQAIAEQTSRIQHRAIALLAITARLPPADVACVATSLVPGGRSSRAAARRSAARGPECGSGGGGPRARARPGPASPSPPRRGRGAPAGSRTARSGDLTGGTTTTVAAATATNACRPRSGGSAGGSSVRLQLRRVAGLAALCPAVERCMRGPSVAGRLPVPGDPAVTDRAQPVIGAPQITSVAGVTAERQRVVDAAEHAAGAQVPRAERT